jgi:hypothetical protein
MVLSLSEWLDLYKSHEEINAAVHEQWRRVEYSERDTGLAWKGYQFPAIDPELLEHVPAVANLAKFWSPQNLKVLLQIALDASMKASPIGENKRIRVRFTGKDTQVHFYTYDENAAIVTLMQFSFDEWMELYRHVEDINRLTQNRLYVEGEVEELEVNGGESG